jgi:small conductance mechanosensitive channel
MKSIKRACAAALAALLVIAAPGLAADKRAAEPAAPAAPQVPFATPIDELTLRFSPLTAEDLAAEARAWQAGLKAKTQEVVEAKIALRKATGDDAKRLNEALLALNAERSGLATGLGEIVSSWESKGGEAEQIEPIRRYVTVSSAEQIQGTQLGTLWAGFVKWLTSGDGGLAFVEKAALVGLALVAIWAAATIASAGVRRAVARVSSLSVLLRSFASRAAFGVTVGAGLLVLLATLGVHVGGLLALIGGASFVLAFAMQSTLSNFAAGLMIMIYRPFDTGDHVEVAGVSGTVQDVSLVSTTVLTPDNRVIVIPNSNVWGSVITNTTGSDTRRVDLVFAVAGDDAARAQRVMEEVLAQHPLVLKEPAPVVRLQEFGADSVKFGCEAWTRTADYWTVHWDVVKEVKQRLDAGPATAVSLVESPAAA